MKAEGRQALASVVLARDVETACNLVKELLRLNAGQCVLKSVGVPISMIKGANLDDPADVSSIVAGLLGDDVASLLPELDLDVVADSSDLDLAYYDEQSDCDLTGTPMKTPLGDGLRVLPRSGEARAGREGGGREQAESRGRGRGGGAGRGGRRFQSSRPSGAELQQWAAQLGELSKFQGISLDRYRGAEFKRCLMRRMADEGLSTKPSDLRMHRHHASTINRQVSLECNEAGTQATCECHSAGPKSLEPRLKEFLSECVSLGLSRVNVVTGLGSHGGGGTIRHMVPGMLQACPHVQSFELASNYSACYVDLVSQ